MAIDLYSACPGGQGRKIKFCCADIAGELDRLMRMLMGEQYVACLDALDRSVVKHPGRACLMAMRCGLLRDVGRHEDAHAATAEFLELHPTNYAANAQMATVACIHGQTALAIQCSQTALAQLRHEEALAENIARIALIETSIQLGGEGHIAAAFALARWTLAHFPESADAQQLLKSAHAVTQLSLIDRGDWPLPAIPEGAPWRENYEQAVEHERNGRAALAGEVLETIAASEPDAPEVWKALALVRWWLADYGGSAEAWRRFAAFGAEWDEVVEALAAAQWMDPRARDADIEHVIVKIEVTDVDRIVELLASDRRFNRLADPDASSTDQGESPPRGIWRIVDRSAPTAGEPVTIDNVPHSLARMALYGKQTRQAAWLALQGRRSRVRQALVVLRDALSAFLSPLEDVEVRARPHQLQVLLASEVDPSPGTSEDEFDVLSRELSRRKFLEVLPTTPLATLGGSTLAEAARDPARRAEAAATLLLVLAIVKDEHDFGLLEELRVQLELPAASPLSMTETAAQSTPMHQLLRLDVGSASSDLLTAVLMRVASGVSDLLTERFARALLRRDDASVSKKHLAYVALAQLGGLASWEIVEEARAFAAREGISTDIWDLLRLNMFLAEGARDEALDLALMLLAGAQQDEALMQQVVIAVSSAGITIDELKQHAMQAEERLSSLSQGNQIWTPETEVAAPKGGGLWLPGAD